MMSDTQRDELRRPAISNIPAGALLSFNYILQTENASGFDVPSVLISANGGAFNPQSISLNQTTHRFLIASLDLGAFHGQSIQVRFEFDTIDGREATTSKAGTSTTSW
jgi:hypothetical protein